MGAAHYRHAAFGAPAAYLAELRRADLLAQRSLTAGGYSPTGHEQHVARTFALSYDRLKPDDSTDALALKLLARAACFAHGVPVPRDLLRASLPGSEEGDGEAERRVEDALGRLGALGLLEAQEMGALVLHRLLAMFVRREAGDAAAAEARAAVEAAVFDAAARLNRAGYPAPLLAWQPHLRAVAEAAAAGGSERAGALYNELGYHLRMSADFAGARTCLERALRIGEAALGPDHPSMAGLVNNLGSVHQAQGDLAGARACFERATQIDEAVYGPDHPEVAIDVSNLALVLEDQGDLAGARACFERALRLGEAALGPDHPSVATRVNNLGTVLREQGDLAGARAYFERALAIFERALGPEHPNTRTVRDNLMILTGPTGGIGRAASRAGQGGRARSRDRFRALDRRGEAP